MKIVQKKHYKSLVLPKTCAYEAVQHHSKIAEILEISDHLLVNGIHTVEVDENWIDILTLLKQKVEGEGKKLRLANLNPQVAEKLAGSLPQSKALMAPGVFEALEDFKAPVSQESKSNFLKGFIQAAPRVLFLQAKMLCKLKRISIKKGDLGLLPGDISGIVKVSSPEGYYAVMLCFPETTFLKLISEMLGENFTELNKDIQDGAAELLSIIYGQVRVQLNQAKSTELNASIPTVFVGNHMPPLEFEGKGVVPLESGKMVTIPFDSQFGPLFIEAWLPSNFSGNFLS